MTLAAWRPWLACVICGERFSRSTAEHPDVRRDGARRTLTDAICTECYARLAALTTRAVSDSGSPPC